jgi:hydrogenase maturation protein HypF
MLERHIHCPITTSAGRLFDAAASLLDLVQKTRFEGQAAMALEFVLDPACTDAYPFTLTETDDLRIADWAGIIEGLLSDGRSAASQRSARFHNALVEVIVAMAQRNGIPAVVLTGGCFQNKYLLERSVIRLRESGFRPYWHQRVPTNDGGIALGQVMAARQAYEPIKEEAYVSGSSRQDH